MFCPNCGKTIPDDSKSCSFCGTPIYEAGNSAVEEEAIDKAKKMAIAGLICSLGVITVPIGLVLSVIAYLRAKKAREMGARGKKLDAIRTLSIISIIYFAIVLVFFIIGVAR